MNLQAAFLALCLPVIAACANEPSYPNPDEFIARWNEKTPYRDDQVQMHLDGWARCEPGRGNCMIATYCNGAGKVLAIPTREGKFVYRVTVQELAALDPSATTPCTTSVLRAFNGWFDSPKASAEAVKEFMPPSGVGGAQMQRIAVDGETVEGRMRDYPGARLTVVIPDAPGEVSIEVLKIQWMLQHETIELAPL